MAEPIRLVVWDLDETFWKGTLTEGGISEYVQAHHDIVIELARRGIVSSICSKNDHDQVKEILEAKGLWDYFVLPSIDWSPKGRRLTSLVEAVQLRASTVIFIDDNPLNLEEAIHALPELQIRSHEFIPSILNHPLFKGKDDRGLNRLSQYKLLERRKADKGSSGENVEDFLRKSGIRVRFDYEVTANIDRAVELINRTNQLNFTKKRLSEDSTVARTALAEELISHDVKAALVGVRDDYGDHGWCGIYIIKNGTLQQFAFSCRILGMQVETWLYQKLGRPNLVVQGDVLTDVMRGDGTDIDWISVETGDGLKQVEKASGIDRVVARGGCDLMPVAHYFSMIAREVIGEFNESRSGMDGRIDHSTFLRQALKGGIGDALPSVSALGYRESDFVTALFKGDVNREVWLLSFWTDAAYVLYQHRLHDVRVPFSLPSYHRRDARLADPDTLSDTPSHTKIREALDVLKSDYDYLGIIEEGDFKQTLSAVFSKGVKCEHIFVLAANEYFVDESGIGRIMPMTRSQNRWIFETAKEFSNVTVLHLRDFVQSEAEVHTQYHFNRIVYFRIFEHIRDNIMADQKYLDKKGWAKHLYDNPEQCLSENLSAHEISRTARFLHADGRSTLALKFAEQAIQAAPHVITHLAILLDILTQTDLHTDLDVTRLTAEIVKSPSRFSHQLGLLFLKQNRLDAAEAMFARASSDEPKAFHHRHQLGNVIASQGRMREALEVLASCLDDGDKNPHVRAHVGRLMISLGQSEKLALLLEGWLRDDPDFRPYIELGTQLRA